MTKPLPLEGIRVLDFTHIVAGPQCTRILGDLGAQVIKVEQEQAMDTTRSAMLGGIGGIPGPNRSGMFEYFNRNKLGITVNALMPAGLDLIKRLVAVSDVVVENFSSRVLERWGLSYEEQREIKSDIIYVSVTGFGHIGRLRDYSTWGGPPRRPSPASPSCPGCRTSVPQVGDTASWITPLGTTPP